MIALAAPESGYTALQSPHPPPFPRVVRASYVSGRIHMAGGESVATAWGGRQAP